MTTTALIYRMIIVVMVNDRTALNELYQDYVKARRLHVSIAEMVKYKRGEMA